MHETNGVEFATAHLATDVTLHYAERGDREGEAIIFLHGYSDSWYSFGRVLPLLSPEYHAFALTQRGHGDSDKPECCYTVDDYAADVDAFMDALGIERATVVGASTGALFAQRAVLSYPHRVSRLALIAAQTPANEIISGFRQEVRAGRSRFFRVRKGVPGEHDPPSGPGRIPCDGGLREPQASGPRLARLHGRGVLSIDREYLDELREVDVPTLILWGEQVALFPREEQERLASAIPGATLKIYPETGHAVHWERPEQVVGDLEAFIEEVSPA